MIKDKKKNLHQRFIYIILFVNIILLSMNSFLSAFLIKKEPYSIDAKIKYKEYMSAAILPFKDNLPEERKYFKNLLRNNLSKALELYKKIRAAESYVEFETMKYSSSGSAEIVGSNNSVMDPEDTGFLYIRLQDDKAIEELIKDQPLDRIDTNTVPNIDIIVDGEIKHENNNININAKVYNNLYGNLTLINELGAYKDVDKLLNRITREIIKAIMVDYAFLNISSNEKEAVIYIDGRYFGRTDKKDILLESGKHKIVIYKDKLQNKNYSIALEKDESGTLEVEYTEKDILQKNKISIITFPDNARIYFDSEYMGTSPLVLDDLVNSAYRIRVEREGYITKYKTLTLPDEKGSTIEVTLEKGDTWEHYFSRTKIYSNLFKFSLLGSTSGAFLYVYYLLKVNDEKAKMNAFAYADPAAPTPEETERYNKLAGETSKRKKRYTRYSEISLYTSIAMLVSAGVFYYFHIAQDDMEIAFYLPNTASPVYSSSAKINDLFNEKRIGIMFTFSF